MWAVILSETSHVFCCVFPTLFSLIGLLAGIGMVATLPPFMIELHDMLHHWELPMIAFSGGILAFGWGATLYSEKVETDHVHGPDCVHHHGDHKNKKVHLVLKIATVLFVFNVFVYTTIHRSNWFITHVMGHNAQQAHDLGPH